jgi:hypothetical protein
VSHSGREVEPRELTGIAICRRDHTIVILNGVSRLDQPISPANVHYRLAAMGGKLAEDEIRGLLNPKKSQFCVYRGGEISMKFFGSTGACSLAPHVALREAGLPFDYVKVDIRSKKYSGDADYRSVNPKGYVPALLTDDGQLMTENPILQTWIADQVPAKKLAPAVGTMDRYRFQETLNFRLC